MCFTETRKDIPSERVSTNVERPTTSPDALIVGPPEFPEFIAVSVWMSAVHLRQKGLLEIPSPVVQEN